MSGKVTDRPVVILLSCVVAAFIAGVTAYLFLEQKIKGEVKEALADKAVVEQLPKGLQGPEGIGVPVGAVLPYAGALIDGNLPESVAANFEICDGELVTTSGPIAGKRKPDLRGRFVRGLTTEELPRMNILSMEKDVTFRPEGANKHDLSHDHGAGDLGAIWSESGGWYHFDLFDSGRPRVFPVGNGGGGRRPTGDLNTGLRLRIDGRSERQGLQFDNRPEHVALVYIIRVK